MVTHIRSMDINRYRHNNKGFCEKFIFPNTINRRRTTIIRVPHASLVELLSSLSLPFVVIGGDTIV